MIRKFKKIALDYLTGKQGQKGSEIEHMSIRMADYLLPSYTGMTIEQKQEMFAVINRMVKISYNFPQNKKVEVGVRR